MRRVYAVAFGVGAACVGAAGALVSPILPFQPAGGLSLSVASFNIVIIGGMGSLLGAFVGGLLVSVAESLGAVFLAPSMKELVSFSLLIVILLFRPAGPLRQARRMTVGGSPRCSPSLALAVLPAVLSSYAVTVFIFIFFYAYLGQAWNIVGGYAGQLSAGHAAFVGVGAYTSAMLSMTPGSRRGSACSWAARWPPRSAR